MVLSVYGVNVTLRSVFPSYLIEAIPPIFPLLMPPVALYLLSSPAGPRMRTSLMISSVFSLTAFFAVSGFGTACTATVTESAIAMDGISAVWIRIFESDEYANPLRVVSYPVSE